MKRIIIAGGSNAGFSLKIKSGFVIKTCTIRRQGG